MSHSPLAPYFAGYPTYKNGGYLRVNQEVGDMIDFYNVQYYNQGVQGYDSYNELFIHSTGVFGGTAVKDIHINAGVALDKIIVGKPVT